MGMVVGTQRMLCCHLSLAAPCVPWRVLSCAPRGGWQRERERGGERHRRMSGGHYRGNAVDTS